MAKKYSQCPHCKRDIPVGAVKCYSCGSWVPRHRRFFESVKSSIPLLTVIVLVVTVYQLMLMREAAKQGQQSIDLLKQTVVRMDSSISLNLQQKELVQKSADVSEKGTKEELRPRLRIEPPTPTFVDTTLIVYINIRNIGSSDAENINLVTEYRFPNTNRKARVTYYPHDKLNPGIRMVMQDTILFQYEGNFRSSVDVRYSWERFKEPYHDNKYFDHIYHKDSKKFSNFEISKKQFNESIK